MPTRLADYANKYRQARMEREDGILLVTLHTDGGPMMWGADDDDGDRLADAFLDIARDPENRVVILTGTGATFSERSAEVHATREDGSARYHSPGSFDDSFRMQRRLHANLLDIEAPIVSAINGPARIHSELPLMADIVLASSTTVFQDAPHFPAGIPPGDGMHVVWPLLIGLQRAKYFLLTGSEMTADEAMALGAVNEVLPPEELLPRAREISRMIASRPPLSIRYTRKVLNLSLRRAFEADLDQGLALIGLSISELRGWRMHMGGSPPGEEPPKWGPNE